MMTFFYDFQFGKITSVVVEKTKMLNVVNNIFGIEICRI